MENDIDSFETILGRLHLAIRKNKLKNSRQRENILKILYDQKILYDKPESKVEKHLSPEEIFALSRKNGKSASLSSIYRILAFLEKEGFVLPIETDKSGRRSEIAGGKHHDHLICTECHQIKEFCDEEIERLQEKVTDKYGARLVSHDMRLFVICSECLKKQK